MNVEAVEKLLEETAEAKQYQQVCGFHSSCTQSSNCCAQEISDTLANSLTLDDEDAVQAELEQLQKEALQEEINLPDVPVETPVQDTRVELPQVPSGQCSPFLDLPYH